MPSEKPDQREIERLASSAQPGLVSELFGFLADNQKWWLLPIIIVLAVVGLVVAASSTGLAPFIYTLF